MTVQGHGWDDNIGFPAFRNVIINGGFDVWQRSTDATANTVSGTFYAAADRWQTWLGSATNIRYQRVTGTNNTYAYRIQRASGSTVATNTQITQGIEQANAVKLAGKTVTLSFYGKAGANFSSSSLSARIYTSTSGDINLINTGGTIQGTNTVSLTTTSTRYTVTATIPSNALFVGVNFIVNWTGTAGANDWFELENVQLEIGSIVTPFEFEPYETTLRKCMRYYEKSYRQDITPGTNQSSFPTIVQEVPFITGFTQTDGWGLARILFTVPKRTGPTVTLFNESGTINTATQIIGTTSSTLTNPIIMGNDKGFMFQGGVAAGGSAVKIVYHYTASAEL